MSIRYAILGLLAEQPMHGYRLKEIFDLRVSPLWGLTTGQIYQSLGALERAALVESRGERKGRRPARRVYTITSAGRRDLTAWLGAKPAVWNRPFREDLLIRLMMLREEEASDLWTAIGFQEHEARTQLLRVTHMRRNRPRHEIALDLGRIFLDGMIHQLEADVKNLETFREEIEAWAHRRGVALGRAASPTTPRPFHVGIEIFDDVAERAVN